MQEKDKLYSVWKMGDSMRRVVFERIDLHQNLINMMRDPKTSETDIVKINKILAREQEILTGMICAAGDILTIFDEFENKNN